MAKYFKKDYQIVKKDKRTDDIHEFSIRLIISFSDKNVESLQ